MPVQWLFLAQPTMLNACDCGLQRGGESDANPITAVAAAPHMLLIGRSTGEVNCYTLPDLVPAGERVWPSTCAWCMTWSLDSQLKAGAELTPHILRSAKVSQVSC